MKTLMRCGVLVHLSHCLSQEDRDWKLASAAQRLRIHMLNEGTRPFGRIKTRWMNPNKHWFLAMDEDCAELTCLAVPVVPLDPVDWRLEWLAS